MNDLLGGSSIDYRPYPRGASGQRSYQFSKYQNLVSTRHAAALKRLEELLKVLCGQIRRVAVLEMLTVEGDDSGYIAFVALEDVTLLLSNIVLGIGERWVLMDPQVAVSVVSSSWCQVASRAFDHPVQIAIWEGDESDVSGGAIWVFRTWDGQSVRKSLMLNYEFPDIYGERDYPMEFVGKSIGVHVSADAVARIWWGVNRGLSAPPVRSD